MVVGDHKCTEACGVLPLAPNLKGSNGNKASHAHAHMYSLACIGNCRRSCWLHVLWQQRLRVSCMGSCTFYSRPQLTSHRSRSTARNLLLVGGKPTLMLSAMCFQM